MQTFVEKGVPKKNQHARCAPDLQNGRPGLVGHTMDTINTIGKFWKGKLDKNKKSQFILNNFVSTSLSNWSSFKDLDLNSAKDKIQEIDSKFENLKNIFNAN